MTIDQLGVINALTFIEQLRQRNDQPGEDFANILQPLADAYKELLASTPTQVEWQVRMPEDRRMEDGWQNNNEQGALYLERECGAEVRTRHVSEWKTR